MLLIVVNIFGFVYCWSENKFLDESKNMFSSLSFARIQIHTHCGRTDFQFNAVAILFTNLVIYEIMYIVYYMNVPTSISKDRPEEAQKVDHHRQNCT